MFDFDQSLDSEKKLRGGMYIFFGNFVPPVRVAQLGGLKPHYPNSDDFASDSVNRRTNDTIYVVSVRAVASSCVTACGLCHHVSIDFVGPSVM
ncbi:hypothetical protein TNCV_4466841 [Trichonephila clavipes]|nr:hypothetical protein TNCV_4466841 [Trichonephila clavipes]